MDRDRADRVVDLQTPLDEEDLPADKDPGNEPMVTAETEFTKAQGAVMATSPASNPFAIIEISGLPYFHHI